MLKMKPMKISDKKKVNDNERDNGTDNVRSNDKRRDIQDCVS